MQKLRVIDTHTGGEPTRVVVSGFPDLGPGTVAEQRDRFRRDFDAYRRALVNEPRGSAVMVGAVLLAGNGVIFFNNVGYLGMCGHGAIGMVAALAYLQQASPGKIVLRTPVGEVAAELLPDGEVSLENVASYVYKTKVKLEVPNFGEITGDIAYGGNWFFLVDLGDARLPLAEAPQLTAIASLIRQALRDQNITGAENAEIDHVELFGQPEGEADSRNFVLCPGLEYDRSPCGTGTSAKLALLAHGGQLAEGQLWRQESIVGSVFKASYRRDGERIIPTLRGQAWVNADTTVILDESDPFCWGISA
jgi:proline racemase